MAIGIGMEDVASGEFNPYKFCDKNSEWGLKCKYCIKSFDTCDGE
jgi:hypothetical protein